MIFLNLKTKRLWRQKERSKLKCCLFIFCCHVNLCLVQDINAVIVSRRISSSHLQSWPTWQTHFDPVDYLIRRDDSIFHNLYLYIRTQKQEGKNVQLTRRLLRSLLSLGSRFKHRSMKSIKSALKCEFGRVGGGWLTIYSKSSKIANDGVWPFGTKNSGQSYLVQFIWKNKQNLKSL